ncbi:hypothetical protein GCM10009304_02210 [Pseudomonas matsuisoli]|uniref:Uncharacterized protein n=1 Tax=Pseudomonas matsuisoli TaxID=1515666 RepID=A0A917PIP6_9PSED|nr:hypothetical protein GCM10009304_02210 [Pseudomonas matsuisoli]
MGSHMKADMTGAATKIKYPCIRITRHECLQLCEFLTLRVNSAVQIGAGLIAELALDDIIVVATGRHGTFYHLSGKQRLAAMNACRDQPTDLMAPNNQGCRAL